MAAEFSHAASMELCLWTGAARFTQVKGSYKMH